MKVTVGIPTFNRSSLLKKAIQSVLDQTYQDFEILVCDDGSTDDTASVVKSFTDPRIKYLYKENGGLASARNLGVRNATGSLFAMLDDDDWWEPEHLSLVVEFFELYPSSGMVYTQNKVFYADGSKPADVSYKSKEIPHIEKKEGFWLYDDIFPEYLNSCISASPCVVFRSSVFDKVGLFFEDVSSGQDYDMFLRVSNKYKVGVVKKPTVNILCVPSGISQGIKEKKYFTNMLKIWKHIKEECELSSEQLEKVDNYIRGFEEKLNLVQG